MTSITFCNLTASLLELVVVCSREGYNFAAGNVFIAPGEKVNISMEIIISNGLLREIHVKSGEETVYVFHSGIGQNIGKCCFLEMGNNGVLRASFETHPPENIFQRIWNNVFAISVPDVNI